MDHGESSYRRYLSGSEEGFVALVRDYKDGLIFYLAGIVGSVSLAEELAEDTFVRIGVKKPHFSGKSTFKTWLYAIGRNVALDRLRKEKRQETVVLDACEELAESEQLEAGYLGEERKRILYRALRRLKPEQRQALWLFYFEELSAKEIARVMKKRVHNVEVLLSRARQKLKEELCKEGITNEEL